MSEAHLIGCDPRSANESTEKYAAISLPPQWFVRHAIGNLDLVQPGIAPDAKHGSAQDVLFPGGLSVSCPNSISPKGLQRYIIAASTCAALHEAMEVVRLDGKSIAEPHPENEDEMWDFLMEEVLELLSQYVDRWPKQD